MCQGNIYHYDGYCFNKNRVPEGSIAIRVEECERLSLETNYAEIISN